MEYREKPAQLTTRIALAPLALALIMLPPSLGRLAIGKAVSTYWAFPLQAPRLAHAGFSWSVFWACALAIALAVAPFAFRLTASRARSGYGPRTKLTFPWWGWLGLALLLTAWALAWGAVPAAPSIRRHAFTGLWLCYIVVANALTYRRTGSCLLTGATWRLLLLFPASAAFWWVFEYLNQFTGNWHYHQLGGSATQTTAVLSSLPFSTVLPAVVSTRDLLATFAALSRGLDQWWRPPRLPRTVVVAALALAIAALGSMAVYPDWLYPAVWLAPLIVITALQALVGERSLLTPLTYGNWAALWLAALAGLMCGLFWELWNWQSLARWSYSIAYVDRFHLFAMPVLGYGGYLPFGLTCIAAARLLTGLDVTPFAVEPNHPRNPHPITPARRAEQGP